MSLKWILNIFPAYDMLVEYSNIEKGKNIKIHESWVNSRNEHICIFCGNIVENEERKDEAHAIPECVGNKVLINKCECYKCNHLFGPVSRFSTN